MSNGPHYFSGVTLLITHYNRSSSLQRLLTRFSDLGCRFDAIVVSDDASKPPHPERLRTMSKEFGFRLVEAANNTGFAGNMNKGQDAVQTPFTLYVQEDFVPSEKFPVALADALRFLVEDPSLDYIRFWSFFRYPTLTPYGKGFSNIVYSPWNLNHRKFFMYSDNPHLRRSTFLQKFGRYKEGLKSDVSEHLMAVSFMQKKGKGLFYDDHESLFAHLNPPDEPSTVSRQSWKQKRNPAILFMRWMYLKYKFVKCLWQLKFTKL